MYALTSAAQRAYAPASAATQTPNEIELQAFAHVTGLLHRARADGSTRALAEAMHANVRLWSALAADAASDGNRLPAGLRAQIVSLALFARSHMARVLNAGEDVEALIDVNTAIMRGLRGDPGAPS